MTWRTLGPLAAALAIAGIAIALLAPNHGNTPLDPVAEAADTTAAAGSAEFGMSGNVSVAGQSIPISGSGAVDMRNRAMRMDISFPIPGAGQLQMEELLTGTTIYMHLPSQLASRMPGGKTWMKVDLAALGKAQGVDMKQLMQSNQSNPTDMLQALKTVGSSRVVGHEDIGGVATTHYSANIDLSKAASRIADKQTVASLKQLYSQAGISSFPIDVWVDRVGRVRRESMNLTTNQFSMQMTIEFTRFGVPVDVTPPSSDQVLDAGSMLNGLGG